MTTDAVAAIPAVPGGPGGRPLPDAYWRSLQLFNTYRVVSALLLLLAVAYWDDLFQFGSRDMPLYLIGSSAYAGFGLAMFALIRARERFNLQLAVQVGGDIVFIVLLMYTSGGLSSGLGLLLLTSLAAAGLVARGRLTLFFAAIATIAILLELTYEVLRFSESGTQYAQAGLLSIGYFAIAWLAHTLAKRSLVSEQLAAQREIDLANMAQVNQLVIQDMEHGVIVVDGDGIVRQPEFVDQALHSLRLFEWIQILALDVFDEGELEGTLVVGLADDYGDDLEADLGGGAPSPTRTSLMPGRGPYQPLSGRGQSHQTQSQAPRS